MVLGRPSFVLRWVALSTDIRGNSQTLKIAQKKASVEGRTPHVQVGKTNSFKLF